MTDNDERREVPDTGFRLQAVIRDVLNFSEATDPETLALEVLDRIPSYDRETALFQALKVMVRESWRPKFIPAPRPSFEEPQSHQGPPPERDGRQWMDRDAPDEPPRSPSWAEVRKQRPPNEDAVAAHRAELEERMRTDPQFANEVITHTLTDGPLADDVRRRANDDSEPLTSDEVEDELKAKEAAERAEQVRNVYQNRKMPSTAPGRRAPTPLPRRPQPSPRVAGIREAWRRTLRQRIAVETGHKFFGDCTVMDLEYAADQREQHAARTQARADELRKLAKVMRNNGADTLKELSAETLAELESSLATAAA